MIRHVLLQVAFSTDLVLIDMGTSTVQYMRL